MSEAAANNTENKREFVIQKIYLKDMSFESPNSPAVFTTNLQPQIGVELNTNGKAIAENIFEVELTVTVTAKQDDKTAFLVEVKQCGIFTITGIEDDELGAMLGSFCPNILFPYAREAISDLVTKGGFPQLLLAPVNFDALYVQHLQQQSNEQAH